MQPFSCTFWFANPASKSVPANRDCAAHVNRCNRKRNVGKEIVDLVLDRSPVDLRGTITQRPERRFTSGLVCVKALFLDFHAHQSACELSPELLNYARITLPRDPPHSSWSQVRATLACKCGLTVERAPHTPRHRAWADGHVCAVVCVLPRGLQPEGVHGRGPLVCECQREHARA